MKNLFFFYWLFLNLGLSNVHIIFWRFFVQQLPYRKRGQFPLLIACIVAPFGCGVRRVQFQSDVRKETHVASLA